MDMKLYGICFKMRGGPDFLSYIQTNTPVPVEMMGQVMAQMGTVTPDEMAYAEKLSKDWKRAFSERVPMLMKLGTDGGYDIACTVPDPLLDTVSVLHGMSREKIVEEYVASYLKDVCGLDVSIVSVDMDKQEQAADSAVQEEPAEGFDFTDLSAVPDTPAFENISDLERLSADDGVPEMAEEPVSDTVFIPERAVKAAEEPVREEPARETPVREEPIRKEPEIPAAAEETPAAEEKTIPEVLSTEEEPAAETAPLEEEPVQDGFDPLDDFEYDGGETPDYDGSDVPIEEGYPEQEGFPDLEEDGYQKEDAPDAGPDGDADYQHALADIYRDFVANIKDRKLDRRLGLKIGQ